MKCFSAQKADVDGFPVRSQLLWFYPASGETRAREAENAYGSINALIWPRFRFVNYSFRSGLKKKLHVKFASKFTPYFPAPDERCAIKSRSVNDPKIG